MKNQILIFLIYWAKMEFKFQVLRYSGTCEKYTLEKSCKTSENMASENQSRSRNSRDKSDKTEVKKNVVQEVRHSRNYIWCVSCTGIFINFNFGNSSSDMLTSWWLDIKKSGNSEGQIPKRQVCHCYCNYLVFSILKRVSPSVRAVTSVNYDDPSPWHNFNHHRFSITSSETLQIPFDLNQ